MSAAKSPLSVTVASPTIQTASPLGSPIRSALSSGICTDNTGRDEFLILACDGIFDVITNQELCDFVRSRLQITNRLELICNQILDSCLSKVRFLFLSSFLFHTVKFKESLYTTA